MRIKILIVLSRCSRIQLQTKSTIAFYNNFEWCKKSKEVLNGPAIISQISDTKALGEVKTLETFYTMLRTEPAKAFYGKKHVKAACEAQAIETLFISDKLFRCNDIATRKEYVNIVEAVKDSIGNVVIFSSMHISGEQLDQLTGIAAILRFPMPELEDEHENESEDSD